MARNVEGHRDPRFIPIGRHSLRHRLGPTDDNNIFFIDDLTENIHTRSVIIVEKSKNDYVSKIIIIFERSKN